MTHLTFWSWVIIGLEGVVNMLDDLARSGPPLTQEMYDRIDKCRFRIEDVQKRVLDKVEDAQ